MIIRRGENIYPRKIEQVRAGPGMAAAGCRIWLPQVLAAAADPGRRPAPRTDYAVTMRGSQGSRAPRV